MLYSISYREEDRYEIKKNEKFSSQKKEETKNLKGEKE